MQIRAISSMATRQVLAELAMDPAQQQGLQVSIESVGGVDAARRVMDGEQFDVVVLAADAIDKLFAANRLLAGSRIELMHSAIAVAVPAGVPAPDIGSEAALRAAVLAADAVSYSTGPSGAYLAQLFVRWGIAAELHSRLVVPPPGVPVASMLAQRKVSLGFQQLSELQSVPGVQVLGVLPDEIAFVTTFAAGIGLHSQQADAAAAWLQYLRSPLAALLIAKHGMTSAAAAAST